MAIAEAADSSIKLISRQFDFIILILCDWICMVMGDFLICKQNPHVLDFGHRKFLHLNFMLSVQDLKSPMFYVSLADGWSRGKT